MTTLTQHTAVSIEKAEDFMEVVADLMDEPISITEYLNGRPWSATIQRPNHLMVEFDNMQQKAKNARVLFEQRLDYFLEDMMRSADSAIESITIRGIYLGDGISGSMYQIGHPEVKLYDMEVNGSPLDAAHAYALFDAYGVRMVPRLSTATQTLSMWLNRRPLNEAAIGYSKLARVPRAGIVIRPLMERSDPSLGRVILKQLV